MEDAPASGSVPSSAVMPPMATAAPVCDIAAATRASRLGPGVWLNLTANMYEDSQ